MVEFIIGEVNYSLPYIFFLHNVLYTFSFYIHFIVISHVDHTISSSKSAMFQHHFHEANGKHIKTQTFLFFIGDSDVPLPP